jgi:hypothetical protein
MRKNVSNTSLMHRMHRDTICQTIAFVRTSLVQRETGHECFMTQRRNFDVRPAENSFSLSDCAMAGLFAILRKEIQEFYKHVFSCDQFGFRNQFTGCDCALMPLVSGVEERHKIESVNECDFQGCCFGAP